MLLKRDDMNRVLILGSGGAGKSVLARRLGALTGLPVIHLDREHWRPGWVEPPKDEWVDAVCELVARPQWIMDGNFGGTMELRLAAADTVIFLDLPRWLCLWRVLRRVAMHAGRTRPDMASECDEKFDPEFLRWVWDYPNRSRATVIDKINRYATGRRIHVLRSPAEVEGFLERLKL